MGTTQSISGLISALCEERTAAGDEFDVEDVLAAVMASNAWQDDAERLARSFIRTLIIKRLKSDAGQDAGETYPQLALAGFERVPKNVPFYAAPRCATSPPCRQR